MKRILMLTSLALAASLAVAQGPGPGPQGGPQGGPGGQGRGQGRGQGFGMGRMGGGLIQLVMRPEVQKELALTEAQLTKIKELMPPRPGGQGRQGGPNGGGGGFGGPPPAGAGGGQGGPEAGRGEPQQGVPPGERGGQNRDRMQEAEKKLKDILTESQWKRLNEISLQQQGPMALVRSDIAKQVGLTEEQTNKIRLIQEGQQQAMRDRMQELRESGDREGMRAEMEKMRAANGKQILDVLTAEQKAKWQQMLGKEFKFENRGR